MRKKKEQKALKNWRRLINAVRIAERVRQEYGSGSKDGQKKAAGKQQSKKEFSRLRVSEDRPSEGSADDGGGGFLIDEPAGGGFLVEEEAPPVPEETPRMSKVANLVNTLGRTKNQLAASHENQSHSEEEEDEEGEEEDEEEENVNEAEAEVEEKAPQSQARAASRGKIVSLAAMAAEERVEGSQGASSPVPVTQGESSQRVRKRTRESVAKDAEPAQRSRSVRRAARQPAPATDDTEGSQSPAGRRSSRLATSDTSRKRLRATQAAEQELDDIVNGLL